MGSRFDAAFRSFARPALARFFGASVRFVRGNLASELFTARRGDREYKAIGHEYGIEVTILMRDFMLPISSVVIDGDQVEPRTGDRLIADGETFEVCPPDENRPSVELPPGSADWRVHTKKIQ
jgi:hypothetical protein